MKASPLPQIIKLPFDYSIKVVVLPKKELESLLGRDCEGAFLPDAQTLVVSGDLTVRQRRYVVAHELAHAINEFLDVGLRHRIMEVP